jgi:multiple sugar transport system permease protein
MRTRRVFRSSDSAFGYALLLPALIVFCLIILYPFANSMVMSLTDQSMLKLGRRFIGLANFRKIASDPNFLSVLGNTAVFVIGSVALPFTLGFIWALILNEKFRLSEFLRGVTLVNWIIPSTAIGFLWMWMFNGDYGVINGLLRSLGVIDSNINWLGQERVSMLVVILARTWQLLPWYMAFTIGGLQGVSIEQTEAAKIDGASNWKILRHVVIPEMKPLLYLVLILGTIGALQAFDLIWVMTEGGPARATTTLAIEVYRNAFRNWNIGLAASVGVVWVLVLSVFSFLYVRANSRNAT